MGKFMAWVWPRMRSKCSSCWKWRPAKIYSTRNTITRLIACQPNALPTLIWPTLAPFFSMSLESLKIIPQCHSPPKLSLSIRALISSKIWLTSTLLTDSRPKICCSWMEFKRAVSQKTWTEIAMIIWSALSLSQNFNSFCNSSLVYSICSKRLI